MQEKRKNVRLPIKLKLEVSNLFKQDGVKIENLDAEIEVFDISKAGIGFMSLSKLPVNLIRCEDSVCNTNWQRRLSLWL